MKVVIFSIGFLLTSLVLVELTLRLFFGFGNPPLYMADEAIGYLFQPNQRLRRFGNRIHINQYSMRSTQIQATRPADTLRIFILGDSIVNGNWWTDQTETLSALVENNLSQQHLHPIEVLNASANSWGPRNELAYLEKFGTFEAQVIMLVINTDDLFGTQPSSLQVGKDRSYPNKKPPLAIFEVLKRLKKQSPIPGLKEIHNEKGDRVGKNLNAIHNMHTLVGSQGGQLLLAMTPLKREVLDGPRHYELIARQRVDDFVATQQIPYVDFLPIFQSHDESETLYRDHIHLSPMGNQLVAQALDQLISDSLASSILPTESSLPSP